MFPTARDPKTLLSQQQMDCTFAPLELNWECFVITGYVLQADVVVMKGCIFNEIILGKSVLCQHYVLVGLRSRKLIIRDPFVTILQQASMRHELGTTKYFDIFGESNVSTVGTWNCGIAIEDSFRMIAYTGNWLSHQSWKHCSTVAFCFSWLLRIVQP